MHVYKHTRLAILVLLAAGALGVTAAGSADAEGLDWAINGAALASGQSIGVKVTSLGSTKISAPKAGVVFVCKGMAATGTVTGGEVGTSLIKPKFKGCSDELDPKCHVKLIGAENEEGHTDWLPARDPVGSYEPTWFWGPFKEPTVITRVKKCPEEGEYPIGGGADSTVTSLEHAEVSFPEEPLESSNLTVKGMPAVWTGAYKFILKGKGTLSLVVVP